MFVTSPERIYPRHHGLSPATCSSKRNMPPDLRSLLGEIEFDPRKAIELGDVPAETSSIKR